MSRRETRTYTRVDNGFKMSSELQKGDWVNNVLKGTVGASFVSSARDAGLTSTEISAVIKAMQWQMDFRKLKKRRRVLGIDVARNARRQARAKSAAGRAFALRR